MQSLQVFLKAIHPSYPRFWFHMKNKQVFFVLAVNMILISRISEYEISKTALNDLVISLHGFVAGEVHIHQMGPLNTCFPEQHVVDNVVLFLKSLFFSHQT